MSVIHCLSLPMHTSPKSLHWHSGPKYKTSTITFQKITNLFMSELSKEALGKASIERDTVTTHTHNISMIKYLPAAKADNFGGWKALSEQLQCNNTDWLFFPFSPHSALAGVFDAFFKAGPGSGSAWGTAAALLEERCRWVPGWHCTFGVRQCIKPRRAACFAACWSQVRKNKQGLESGVVSCSAELL